ncbi:MAG: TSUP family transporter, partial [Acidimicrobiia bacterium]|nr:TSUP family transporter [Acidimicrobiia bacterium]
YGGFVQAGVGFLLLAGLVLGGGLDLVRANAAKVVIIASYTVVALVIFFGAAQVNLGVGLVLAAGNSTGAFVSSRIAMKRGAGWVRWILVVAAVAAAIRMAFL